MHNPGTANEADFDLEGVHFKVNTGGDYRRRLTDHEGVVLVKDQRFVQAQLHALEEIDVHRMVELGVFQGGSAVLWSLVLPLERYVGIDLQDVDLAFPESVTGHPRWQVVRLFGHTSQDDAVAVRRILDVSFDRPLDLVVDDASHQYAPSRASFQILFPRLRPGGMYMLEDWAWAHRPGAWQDPSHQWAHRPALSNLVIDFIEFAGSRPDLVDRVEVNPYFVLVHRGPGAVGDDFDLSSCIARRGKKRELI